MALSLVKAEAETIIDSATKTKIVLVLEYEGTRYHGFQLQAGLRTVQSELEGALEQLTGEGTRVLAASRTDAGVHARGQVVSFRTRSTHSVLTFVNGLNYYLPGDIAVKSAHRVSDSFNVRKQAVSREYNYYILNDQVRSPLRRNFTYLVRGGLDIAAMNQACQVLIGDHDFASFASALGPEVKSTVRRVYRAEVKKDGEMTVFNMLANAYLLHQVRNTVGALLKVGLGKMSGDEFHRILEARKIGLAGPTAPARGLCLMQINYARPFEEEV